MAKADNKVTVLLQQGKDRTNSLGFLSEEFVLVYKRETGGVCHDRNDTYISRYADGAISFRGEHTENIVYLYPQQIKYLKKILAMHPPQYGKHK